MRCYLMCSVLLVFGFVNGAIAKQKADDEISIEIASEILVGETLELMIVNCPPNSMIEVTAERDWGWDKYYRYRSTNFFRVDESGIVNLTKQAPIENVEVKIGAHETGEKSLASDEPTQFTSNYQGVEPLGFLWSMVRVSDAVVDSPSKGIVELSVKLVEWSNKAGLVVASKRIELIKQVEGLVEHELSDDSELEGAFVLKPQGDQPLPVVIIFGGSEGGDSCARNMAPVFASRGYAAVGLPYYAPNYGYSKRKFLHLPTSFTEIPIDRVEKVLALIEADPTLDANSIGVYGVSKGGEFVLALSSLLDRFKAVVAVVPSDVIWEGWGSSGPKTSCFSWRDEPLPYVPYEGMEETIAKLSAGEKANMRIPHDAGRQANPERVEAARIKVEKIKAALMVVGGDQDSTWDSGGMCRNIVETRQKHGLKTEAWVSPDAGHYLSGPAYRPMADLPNEASFRSKVFPAMLRFLELHLID